MEDLIKTLELKIEACSDATKEGRARKGAYVDCLIMVKEWTPTLPTTIQEALNSGDGVYRP